MKTDTLNDIIDQAAVHAANKPAFFFDDADGNERQWSFRELRQRILRTAAAFRSTGIGRGDTVAIIHRNDPAFIVAYFGAVRVGAIAVPINFMVSKPDELRFMFEHSGAKAVVTQKEFLRGILKAREGLGSLKHVWSTDPVDAGKAESFWDFVGASEPFEGGAPAEGDETVCILYTSGTTGTPKGVMLTHNNLVSNVDAAIAHIGFKRPNDKGIVLLPMFHTFAWLASVIAPLRSQVPTLIIKSVTPPAPWLKKMGRHGVTAFAAVPQLYAVLAKQATGLKRLFLRFWCFRKVRIALSGAAPLSKATLEEFRDRLGAAIQEGYGLTETSPVVSVNPVEKTKPGSVGLPIPDVEVRIVDENGKTLATAGEGEILVRGPNVMKGYYHNAPATQAAIDPEGWFRTGDVGCLDEEGYLYIRDRIKDMIIIKGLKVFSAQVEKVLLEHPAIQEAAVVGIPEESGDERIKAFLVLNEGAAATEHEIHQFCRKRFDGYKRPKEIEIIDELPKNALQKTLKRELRDRELKKQKGGG